MRITIKNILLDYDDTLGASEGKAFEACCAWINECLSARAVSKRFSVDELMEHFVGASFRAMITQLSKTYSFQLSADELEVMVAEEQRRVIAKLSAELEPAPGVNAVLAQLKGKYKLAVVSSSALARVHACLTRTGQDQFIPSDLVFSAASSLAVPTSKPSPAIYEHALTVLNATAEHSLAVEDSRNGVLSCQGASIPVVGYVGCHPAARQGQVADKLRALGVVTVMEHWDEFPGILADIESGKLALTGVRA